jgi:hypothetical protein
VAVACGSSGTSSGVGLPDGGFGSGHDATTVDSGHRSLGDAGGAPHDGGALIRLDAVGDVKAVAPDAACATTSVSASLIPAYLVFVMDRSDSMKQYGKWPACQSALETFFQDPKATGISSSLTFLPWVKPDASLQDFTDAACQSAMYATPAVPMTALPSGVFKPVIEAEQLALGTPTRPALEGALAYAQTIQAGHPGDKVLIVLATDGYPSGCGQDKVGNVADAAHFAHTVEGIPVYVIGLGPDTDANVGISNLNQVAEAGGTGSAFFIPTAVDGGDSGITTTAFLDAVHKIQSTLGCKYGIPAAPAGQTLDYDEVNVVLTIAGKPTTIPYSEGCVNANGWQYGTNDAGTPDEILLCPAACDEARDAGSGGAASVALGCATVGGMPPK